jgi:hypothetical protein
VTGAHVARGKSDPLRIPAEVGQFSHDSGGRALVELAFFRVHNGGGGSSDAADVLQKHEPRFAIGCNAGDFEKEAASLSIKPSAPTGNAEVLAWEAGNDAIHSATPRLSVEGANVGPDRCRIQRPFFHARCQDASGICLPLNVANGAIRDTHVGEPGSQSFSKHADA